MVTPDEVGQVSIFAGLDSGARERLSRVAADVSLMPGEYAAHEGDERALFAVLEGRLEPIKLVDGIERVVGERRPGEIFRRGADDPRDGRPSWVPGCDEDGRATG